MNPWLITWEPTGKRAEKTIRNRIAAILPNRTGEEQVKKILHLLTANYWASSGLSGSVYISEQVACARGRHTFKAIRHFFPVIECGSNPFLLARHVYNLAVSKDDRGYEEVRWEEPVFPAIDPNKDVHPQIEAARPLKRKRMLCLTRSNFLAAE
jgi:hypothetical protein